MFWWFPNEVWNCFSAILDLISFSHEELALTLCINKVLYINLICFARSL